MTKIAFISPTDFVKKCPFGGTSGFIENISPQFNSPVTILGAATGDTRIKQNYDLDDNVEFIPLFKIKKKAFLPQRIKAFWGFLVNRRYVLNSPIDVLYVHSPESALPFLFGNKKIPVIFHQHGSANPVLHTKHKFARNIVNKKFFDWILAFIYKRADWVIVIDRLCLAQAKSHGIGYKTTLLMNAVDKNCFKPDEIQRKKMRQIYGISDDTFVILFVGRLESVKCVDNLIKSLTFLQGCDKQIKLIIAGDGTMRSNLEALASSLDLPVRFLGKVKHDRLNSYYNMSDVLVLPSKMEGVPMAILESLSCGTPVIATKVGGIPDIVHDQNGILLEEAEPRMIADAILNISQTDFLREEVSKTVDNYSTEKFVQALESIFHKVLAQRNSI